MPANTTPIFPATPAANSTTFANADAQTLKTIFTAGINGSRVDAISVSSTDTSVRDFAIYMNVSGSDVLLATVSVPANSGFTNGVQAKSVLVDANLSAVTTFDAYGNRTFALPPNAILKAAPLVAVTSAKVINFTVLGGNF